MILFVQRRLIILWLLYSIVMMMMMKCNKKRLLYSQLRSSKMMNPSLMMMNQRLRRDLIGLPFRWAILSSKLMDLSYVILAGERMIIAHNLADWSSHTVRIRVKSELRLSIIVKDKEVALKICLIHVKSSNSNNCTRLLIQIFPIYLKRIHLLVNNQLSNIGINSLIKRR